MAEADRIRWNCRRGMLELDLVLNAFVDRTLNDLDPDELDAFRRLLEYPDQELLALVMRRADAADRTVRGVLERVRGA